MTNLQGTAILCAGLLVAPQPGLLARSQTATGSQSQQQLAPGQLDSLVAPVALYPDPILSQTLVASTYPVEIVEAARWAKQNGAMQPKELAAAAAKQPWDASVQAMVAFPDLLTRLNQDLSWTTELGNAFLSDQDGVMQAIQRMRQKASAAGALSNTAQQTVTTTSDNGQTYIEIQPASPEVVYIPEYNPAAIWGPADYYPYPALYYPPAGAIAAASAISFGAGVAVGAIWANNNGWHGWGWNTNWGHNNVVVNNNFINNNHFNRVNVANGNAWVHNPDHRNGVPYDNRALANQFSRPTANQTMQKLDQMGQHGGMAGQGGVAQRAGERGGIPSQGSANRTMPNNGGMGGDRIGNRQMEGGSAGHGAFGGMNQGGFRTQMNSDRGFASRGGGFHGGGGRRR